ncbi:MAG: two-component system response regulator [Myxococcales bacterium]|nr:two-component system response regulator [Myxococcales bacterium]
MRILIVDDSPMVRRFYRASMEGDDLVFEEAANGLEALEKSLRRPFDLLLVDINMPLMDGFCFMREVRQREELCHTPAIIISTEAEQQDVEGAFQAGANFYLTKPMRPEVLRVYARLLAKEEDHVGQ